MLALLHLRVDGLLLLRDEQLQLVHVEELVEQQVGALQHLPGELGPRELLDLLEIQLDLMLELLIEQGLWLLILLTHIIVDHL